MNCDVIVPIYNAYECVVECIDTLIKNTDLKNNRLILINDCSTDERIKPLLKNYSSQNENIIFLDNTQNLGFVKTVNKGMKYGTSDVVLLNSDTEVPKNWLEKLKKCAYSSDNVGTVTPLSNNATLVSVPNGLQRNEILNNMSLNKYNELIENSSYHEYPELPTSHGFCVYIRRNVINEIGFFDEQAFEKGYGEENDFSFRCLEFGYKNIMCDDLLVYHKESKSFGNKKRQELIEKHEKLLHERYPHYSNYIGEWCRQFPIKKTCDITKYAINMYDRKNILFIIHDWTNVYGNVGGTTLHAFDLISSLRNKFNFHVLFPSNGSYRVHSYFENEEAEIVVGEVTSANSLPTYDTNYKKMLSKIVDSFAISTIHVHHLIGHNFDIIDVAKEKNINTVITLHDLYSICPTVNMLYNGEKYCELVNNPNCEKCLKTNLNICNNIIENWRKKMEKFLLQFNTIVTPSNDTKNIINKYYKKLKINVIEHGINLEKRIKDYDITENEINVAFVGVMALHKGARVLENLVKNNNTKIKYHLFGTSELSSLCESHNNYVYHGKYSRDDLPKLLLENKINLVCMFAIWPETYSYTLTEVISSSIPVLCYDIGAISERVKKYNFGWILPLYTTEKEIEKKIEEIFTNPKEYNEIEKNLKNYKIKTAIEMSNEYVDLYNSTKKKYTINYDCLRDIINKSITIEKSRVVYVESEELNIIKKSLKWRIVSKIEVPKIVKKAVKKIVR